MFLLLVPVFASFRSGSTRHALAINRLYSMPKDFARLPKHSIIMPVSERLNAGAAHHTIRCQGGNIYSGQCKFFICLTDISLTVGLGMHFKSFLLVSSFLLHKMP